MIQIFYFDSNYKSNGQNDIIQPDENGKYEVPSNATDIPPQPGMYQPIYFDKEKQQWIGTSKEEFEKKNKVEESQRPIQTEAVGPDNELRRVFGNLQKSTVQTAKIVMDLTNQVGSLTKQIVELQNQLNEKESE